MADCVWCKKALGFWEGNGMNYGTLCGDCYRLREKGRNGDGIAIDTLTKYVDNIENNLAKNDLVQLIKKAGKENQLIELENKKKQVANEARERAEQKEIEHANYAKSFNEFYEYDVVTIINENHGTIDKEKMMKILSDHAKNGWKLHTMYSNELGKNALSLMGFGINATACEDVLIFERRISNLDE